MKPIFENWRTFLQEDDIDEATAAKKRGIELPSMSSQLRKYAVADSQIPTHYMHFSDINKIGVKPASSFQTPLGIYFYPVNEKILDQLEKGKIPFASERKFVHVVKPNENSNILYTAGEDAGPLHFNNRDLDEKLMKLFSSPVVDKLTRTTDRKTPEGEVVGQLEEKPYFYDKFKKFQQQLENGHTTSTGAARIDLSTIFSKQDKIYDLESQFSDPTLKSNIKEIKKNYKYNPNSNSIQKRDYFARTTRRIVREIIEGKFNGTQEEIDAIHENLGLDPEQDRMIFNDRVGPDEPMYLQQPIFNTGHAKAMLAGWEYLKAKKKQDPESLSWDHYTGEQWKKKNNIPSGKEGKLASIKMTPEIKKSMTAANVQTPLGQLWNITREFSAGGGRDMRSWAKAWRLIGVDGVSDYRGTSTIHEAEPMQAVFFTKSSIQQVKTFDNKMTTGHVLKRQSHQYLREALPFIKKVFSDHLGRNPEKQEIADAGDRISRNIRNLDNPPNEGVATFLQNQYNSGKLGGYSTKVLIAQIVYDIKSEKIIEIFRKLKTTSNDDIDKQTTDIVDDILGSQSDKFSDTPAGEIWDQTQVKINFEFYNEGLALRNAENSLKALQQWLTASKNLWDQTIKKELNIEFPYKRL
tara:strand:- start:76 stop:1980 length:1905 start_codon:yes stop_codon:yes gene_type:complete